MKDFFVVFGWKDGGVFKVSHATAVDLTDRFFSVRDRDGVTYHINPGSVDMVSVSEER